MAMLMGLLVAAGGIALLHKILKGTTRPQAKTMGHVPEGQIIEIDDYEIIDENQNQGYKVVIQ